MNLTRTYKKRVVKSLKEARAKYTGDNKSFAQSIGHTIKSYFKMRSGIDDTSIPAEKWISLGRKLNVTLSKQTWKPARTKVYEELEANLNFCQQHSKAMILIDECGIGKTYCTKHIIKTLKNGFYLDCSQARSKMLFIRELARTIGVEHQGRISDIKADLKYYLNNVLTNSIIALDDAGYMDYSTFLEVQELWNGTEGTCGWYMIGDSSLATKINRGIEKDKIGYKAIFSRFLDDYVTITPVGAENRKEFLKDLIGDVAQVNLDKTDHKDINKIITKCLKKSTTLRYLNVVIQLLKSNKKS